MFDRPAAAPADEFEEPGFVAPPEGTRRRVALVLSGGGARGFAHLGVLRVLEREGLRPDLVVGSSAGAIVGAWFDAEETTAAALVKATTEAGFPSTVRK